MEREFPLQGDILETIFSHVPTITLLPALHVSRSWRHSAISSIRRRDRRPWLLIHHLRRHRRRRHLTFIYDPQSNSHHTLHHVTPPPPITCPFLPLSLPFQPLAATWPLLPPPLLHRRDALTAQINRTLIIAGGACDLGDRTCAVESLSLDSPTLQWQNCEPMPETLIDSAAATWLATAASNTRLYVLERHADDGRRLAWFDLAAGKWSLVRIIQLGSEVVRISAIGMRGEDKLVVVGLMDCGAVGFWELEPESVGVLEIGSLPAEAVARIAGEGAEGMPAVGFSNVGGFGFLYGLAGRGEVFACEFGGGELRWEGIGCFPAAEDPTAMVVFGCSDRAVEELMAGYGKIELE